MIQNILWIDRLRASSFTMVTVSPDPIKGHSRVVFNCAPVRYSQQLYLSLDITHNLLFLSTCWNFHLNSSIALEQILSRVYFHAECPNPHIHLMNIFHNYMLRFMMSMMRVMRMVIEMHQFRLCCRVCKFLACVKTKVTGKCKADRYCHSKIWHTLKSKQFKS